MFNLQLGDSFSFPMCQVYLVHLGLLYDYSGTRNKFTTVLEIKTSHF